MTALWTTLPSGARVNYPWRHGNDQYDQLVVGSGVLNDDHDAIVAAITATDAAPRGATIWFEGEVRYKGDYLYSLKNGQSLRGRGTGAILRCDTHTNAIQWAWNDDVGITDGAATATDISTPNEWSEYISCPTYTPTKGDWLVAYSWDQLTGVNPHYGYGFGQYPLELQQVAYWDNSAKRIYVPAFVRDRLSVAPAIQVISAAAMSKRVVVADLMFRSYDSTQPDYSTVLWFNAIDGLTIENVLMHRNGPGAITLQQVANARLWGLNVQGSVRDELVYAVAVGAVQGVDIADFEINQTRHAFTTTSSFAKTGTAVTGATISSGSPTWTATNSFRDGMAVRLASAVSGFATGTNYWIRDRASGTFALAATPGGSAISATGNGSSNVIWQDSRFGTPLGVHMHDGRLQFQAKLETAGTSRVGIDTHAEGWGIRFSDIDIYMGQSAGANIGAQTRSRGTTFSRVRVYGAGSVAGYALRSYGKDATFVNCEARNTYYGIVINDDSSVAHAAGVDNCEIRDCKFDTVRGAPILLKTGNNHRVINPSFKACSDFASSGTPYPVSEAHIQLEYGTGHEIYDAVSKKGSNDISVNIGPLATTDVTIEGCKLLGYSRRDDANVPTCEIGQMKRLLTADSGTSVINWTAHPLANGDYLQFWINTGGTLPGGISASTWYYVVNKATNTFQISATHGGAPVTLTTNGSGDWGCTFIQVTLNDTYQPYNTTTGGWARAAQLASFAGLTTKFQVCKAATITTYDTFADAYAAMADGDALVLPPQDISVSATLTWARNGCRLICQNGRARFLRATNTTNITTLLNITGTDNVIEGIIFEGVASGTNSSEGRLVTVSANRNTLRHCDFLNAYTTGTASSNFAVYLNSSYNTVESCYVSNATYGGIRSGGSWNRINDCRTYDCQYPIMHVGAAEHFAINDTHIYGTGQNKGTVYIYGSSINGLKTLSIAGLYMDLSGYDYTTTGGGLHCSYVQEANLSDVNVNHTQAGTTPTVSAFFHGVTRLSLDKCKFSGQVYTSGLTVSGFTAATDDTITKTSHGLSNGMVVTLKNTTSNANLPAGLNANTRYYVINAATDTLKLSLTPGGSAVDVTSTGGAGTNVMYLEMEKLVGHDSEICRDVNYTYALRMDSSPAVVDICRCKLSRATSKFLLNPELVVGHRWRFSHNMWHNNQAGAIAVFQDNVLRTGVLFFDQGSNTFYSSAGGSIVSATSADPQVVCRAADESCRIYAGSGTTPATTTVTWAVGDQWHKTDAAATEIAAWQNVTAGTTPSWKSLAVLGA